MIDDHVHPFPLEFAALEPDGITLDVAVGEAAAVRRRGLAPGRLYLHLMLGKLAGLLGVDADEVVTARDARARTDWPGWLRLLFDDAGIAGMVMDEPVNEPGRAADYAAVASRPVWPMARIDTLVDELLGQQASASEVVGAVEAAMERAAAGGCVAFKTILAYRTGLRVDPGVDLAAAQRGLDADADADAGAAVPLRRRGKALRDLVARRVLGRAADLGRPVQIHTGFGDSEIRLADAHPLLLEELLRTPEGSAASVVLIHGSFPWHEAAGYLAGTKPNVWVELSLSNLFAPVGTADRLLRILDLAPRERVLLGTDGHGAPETHWFGARVLAEAWQGVANALSDAGARPGWIEATREAIFETNARALYGLS